MTLGLDRGAARLLAPPARVVQAGGLRFAPRNEGLGRNRDRIPVRRQPLAVLRNLACERDRLVETFRGEGGGEPAPPRRRRRPAIPRAPSERAELQDVVDDAGVQIRLRLATERLDEAVALAREIAQHAERLAPYWDAVAIAVEAFVAAGLVDEAEAAVATARAQQTELGLPYLDLAEGHVRLAKGDVDEARRLLEEAAAEASARGFRLYEWRARILTAEALAQLDSPEEAVRELAEVIGEADSASAVLIRDAARKTATRLGLAVPEPAVPLHPPDAAEPELAQAGERLVTMLFADVRGYTALSTATPPADLAERIGTLHRWAAAEVNRQHGFVDKFAGDAVMATFNATGTRLDHALEALEAALALSGKAALLDLGVGIGIAVGPARRRANGRRRQRLRPRPDDEPCCAPAVRGKGGRDRAHRRRIPPRRALARGARARGRPSAARAEGV